MNVVNKVAFPRFGNYHVPVSFLIKKVLNAVPIIPPNTSRKTLEIGAKHAPDFICVPFKFTLGSMIEALEMGANVIIGIGGTCRLSYYPELQQQILTDLGYKFKFINTSNLNFRDPKFLASLKEINPEVNGSMLIKY
jgi:predicted nucleotide-binding protein (sugar kinase/HSP70/actin superfamily)